MNSLSDEIINSLSAKVKQSVLECKLNLDKVQEIRLRVNKPLVISKDNKEYFVNSKEKKLDTNPKYSHLILKEDIENTFNCISRYSLHSFLEDIKKGFITIKGGHRVGICGKVLIEDNIIKNIKHVSSLNIRISRQTLNCSKKVLKHIIAPSNKIYNTLIVSPPQCGKTTLLRDIVKSISDGLNEFDFKGVKVCVIDERNEIAGAYLGVPQLDVGMRTDILESCPKDIGIMMVLRSMSPNVIVTDEIGSLKEIKALYMALSCGVSIITSVHGDGIEDIRNKKELRHLLDKELFRKIIVLSDRRGAGTVEKIYDLAEKRCINCAN